MKIRSSHLAFGIIAVIVAIFVFALTRSSKSPQPSPIQSNTDSFLSQVHRIREAGGGSKIKDGLVPSTDVDISGRRVLKFSESPVEMGTIANDRIAEKQIIVENPGELPIEVLEIRTSCHCTEGKFELAALGADGRRVTTIGPHRQSTLIVSVDPARVPGFSSHKELTLVTNDPVNSEYTLEVISQVDPEFSMDPEVLDFGTIQRGTQAEIRAVVRQLTDKPLDIIEVKQNKAPDKSKQQTLMNESPVEVELVRRPENQWKSPGHVEWDVLARLSPTSPPGKLHEQFWLFTNLKRSPEFEFNYPFWVDGIVEAFYVVNTASIGARSVATPGQSRVAEATVSAGVPITVTDVNVTGEDLIVEVAPQSEPNNVDIFLSVSPDAKPGLKNEVVSFTVSDGERPNQHTMRAYVSVQSQAPPAQ